MADGNPSETFLTNLDSTVLRFTNSISTMENKLDQKISEMENKLDKKFAEMIEMMRSFAASKNDGRLLELITGLQAKTAVFRETATKTVQEIPKAEHIVPADSNIEDTKTVTQYGSSKNFDVDSDELEMIRGTSSQKQPLLASSSTAGEVSVTEASVLEPQSEVCKTSTEPIFQSLEGDSTILDDHHVVEQVEKELVIDDLDCDGIFVEFLDSEVCPLPHETEVMMDSCALCRDTFKKEGIGVTTGLLNGALQVFEEMPARKLNMQSLFACKVFLKMYVVQHEVCYDTFYWPTYPGLALSSIQDICKMEIAFLVGGAFDDNMQLISNLSEEPLLPPDDSETKHPQADGLLLKEHKMLVFSRGKEDILGMDDAPVRWMRYSYASGHETTRSWDKTLKYWDSRGASGPEHTSVATVQPEHVYAMSLVGIRLVVATAGRDAIIYALKTYAQSQPLQESSLKYLKFQVIVTALSFSKDARLLGVKNPDDDVYKDLSLREKKIGKKFKLRFTAEWVSFVSIIVVLLAQGFGLSIFNDFSQQVFQYEEPDIDHVMADTFAINCSRDISVNNIIPFVVQEGLQFANRLTGFMETEKFQQYAKSQDQVLDFSHRVCEAKNNHQFKYAYVWHTLLVYCGGVKLATTRVNQRMEGLENKLNAYITHLVAMMCRSMGLSGCDDFDIATDAWEALKGQGYGEVVLKMYASGSNPGFDDLRETVEQQVLDELGCRIADTARICEEVAEVTDSRKDDVEDFSVVNERGRGIKGARPPFLESIVPYFTKRNARWTGYDNLNKGQLVSSLVIHLNFSYTGISTWLLHLSSKLLLHLSLEHIYITTRTLRTRFLWGEFCYRK